MKERLLDLVGRLAGGRMLVVGDYMLDQYLWGDASRMSPEAPVPVVRVEREEFQPGGAGNVVRNLCALGIEPVPVGVIGQDRFGELLLGRLELLGVPTDGIIADSSADTIVKTRVIARRQQVVRIDHEAEPGLAAHVRAGIVAGCLERLGSVDGVVFSDYAKGLASEEVVRGVIQGCQAAGKPIFADTKPASFELYEGVALLTPNEKEALEAAGRAGLAGDTLEERGRRLCERMRLEALAITRDARGVLLIEADGSAHHLPGVPTEVVDVTGAGDTVISVMAAAALAGGSMLEAAALANLAGGIVVQRIQCATANAQDLERAIAAEADRLAGIGD